MEKFQSTVKEMVNEQLRTAGFYPDLTAGALSTLPSVMPAAAGSYASVMKLSNALSGPASSFLLPSLSPATQADKREASIWKCRKSLRLWPVVGDDRDAVAAFQKEKVRMDESFLKDDMGSVKVTKCNDL